MINLVQLIPCYGPSAGGVGTVVRNLNTGFQRLDNYHAKIFDFGKRPRYPDQEDLVICGNNLATGLSGVYLELLKTKPTITHLHGVWHPLSLPCSWARRAIDSRHVCSPHGMLEQWILNQNPSKKKIARLLYEDAHWKRVDCFHALTQMEAEEIASIIPVNKPVVVIPNGVDMPATMHLRKENGGAKPYFLYLGRFHKKKGIDELLKAWKLLDIGGDFALKIVGWGELECLEGQLTAGVEVCGPVDGPAKETLYREAEYVILPSFSEGLPMVVLEAWAQGTPVIMTPQCNLASAFAEDAALEIQPEVDSIAAGLRRALDGGASLRARTAEAGFRFCKERYSLDSVIERFVCLHQFLISGEKSDLLDFHA
jgi:glycosyltransferase involved in cell wall biosynthesis